MGVLEQIEAHSSDVELATHASVTSETVASLEENIVSVENVSFIILITLIMRKVSSNGMYI